MTSESLEVTFFVLSVLCIFANGYLFTLKLSDLVKVKRQRVNGPILFMTWDKIRHQCFMLSVAVGMAALAVSGLNNPDEIGAQTRNLLTGSIGFALLVLGDAVFTYRRRIKMAVMVAKYEAEALAALGIPGGKRKHDPPKEAHL